MTEDSNALAPPPSKDEILTAIADFFKDSLEADYSEEAMRKKLADYARNAWQMKEVTHVAKYSHPDAKADVKLFAQHARSKGNASASDFLVGTHSIDAFADIDAAGNSACHPIYTLLQSRVGGVSLLELASRQDQAFGAALKALGDTDGEWMREFATVAIPQARASSHRLIKQIYWPIGDGSYHLLSPLFSSALANHVWKVIRHDRFSDEAKAARKARNEKAAHPHGFREYPELLIQSFGGTKPQNISWLNTKRYGENYLLPALPPNWQSPSIRPPFAVNSVFDRIFSNRPRVRELVRTLRAFLESVVHYNNLAIREKRAELTAYLCDEALLYAAELRDAVETGALAAGWTLDERCQLNRAEQLWLDPLCGEDDPDFVSEYQRDEWPDEICRRFGNWLNARLTTDKLPMSAVEADHWRGVLEKEMRLLRRELADHE